MEGNLLLEQYSRYKKISLSESPYKCLLNTEIETNPHQINAFCAAINAIKTGGIVLADEVGLGKTIEAGLVIKYVLDMGCKNIMIALPATLRKQWEIELDEKFGITAHIFDRYTVDRNFYGISEWLKKNEVHIVLASYDYASKFMMRFPSTRWDFVVIDEAHNLRNAFHGTKRAKKLYELTQGIPKILLTATPIQNSLSDLHALVSFIDPRIFGPEKVFIKHYVSSQDYSELKKEIAPVIYRTLRKDVGKYMDFKKRVCLTVDFHLTQDEANLYNLVNAFLKRDVIYSIPGTNNSLMLLVVRKVLASSSYALVETFELFKKRLKKLYNGTKSSNAKDGFDLLWDFIQDEIDESEFDKYDDEEIAIKKEKISEEIEIVNSIIDIAKRVKTNAKIEALKTALSIASEDQISKGIPEKAVIFTESKRTQKYMAEELRKNGYDSDDIVLFNGDFDDPLAKKIYQAWQSKNYGRVNHGRNVEYKHAIVDYFENNAKILIVTDAGSEGLNLQFCNTVINYDLPWNPQKIEQRIGRCHRYGQKHDVVAINLLNTDNEADKRVYEILSKKFELFEGVFGASDVALGALESGMNFEQTILNIYQQCDSETDFNKRFDELNRELDTSLNEQALQLRNLLLTESPEAKGEALEKTKKDIATYLHEIEYWNQFDEPENDGQTYYWKIKNWGENTFGSHGMLFLGAFCNNTDVLFPVLLLCDDTGEYIDFSEADLVKSLESTDDSDIHYYSPSKEEEDRIADIYSKLRDEMISKYNKSIEPVKEYNKEKVDNWLKIQKEQLYLQLMEMNDEIKSLFAQEYWAHDSLQKEDIRKKIAEKKKKADKFENEIPIKLSKLREDGDKSIEEFNHSFDINPILLINIVLVF